jgi:hypothetical protein
MDVTLYTSLLANIKQRVQTVQLKASLSVSAEMISIYPDVGQIVFERQKSKASQRW